MMSDTKRDYTIGYGKPPKGRPFQKGQSGNPRGPGGKKGLAAMLAVALDERVTITINGQAYKDEVNTFFVSKEEKGAKFKL